MVPPGASALNVFLEQLPATVSAFAMQDVAKRCQGVSATEVSLQQVSRDV